MQIATRSVIRFFFWLLMLGLLTVGGGIVLYTHGRSAAAARTGAAATFYVSPIGVDDPVVGGTESTPFKTLQYALERVPCGSSIQLAAGIYADDTDVNRADCLASPTPIVVSGPPEAVLVGGGGTYIVEVLTGNIEFNGFTIDGEYTPGDYRKKLVYINAEGVNRLRLIGLTLRNAREECVRLRLNAVHNVIANNRFERCGREGGGSTGDNREALYIGTTASQLDDDQSAYNWVTGNTFNLGIPDGTGSECIDIKGNAHHNVVEDNRCFFQSSDPESGGINVEGADNLIVNNLVEGNAGSGIRLGMGEAATPRNNRVIGNTLRNNRAFGINMVYEPTEDEVALIRGNCIEDNAEGNVNRRVLEAAGGGVCAR